MVSYAFHCHCSGLPSTEESVLLIDSAQTVELMAFSRDGDPLAMVSIAKSEALTLMAIPVTMGHVFRASHVGRGRVFREAVEWED